MTNNAVPRTENFQYGGDGNPDIVVSLDIGTTKICALITRVVEGAKPEDRKIDVLGVGMAPSKGLQRGVIYNVPEAVEAIKEAVQKAEIQSGLRITKVIVGIAGQHIKCFKHRNYLTREINNFITQEDIDDLLEQVHKIVLPYGEKIIHVLPVTYKVNNDEGVINPVGMRCTSLEGDFLIVTGQEDSIENIGTCVEQAGLEIAGLILEPIASSISVLNDREKDAGVALVDIGGGTTDIAIFQKGIIRHTAVIPFGGNSITEDVEEGCEVLKDDAELLKIKHGSSLVLDKYENVVITIPDRYGNHEPHRVSMKNLALIIHARMDEILEEVYHHIRKSGFENKLRAGIVLTGGGSLLKNIDHHCKYLAGVRSRKGNVSHKLYQENSVINSPKFATAVGLGLKGYGLVQKGKVQAGFVTMNEKSDEQSIPKIDFKVPPPEPIVKEKPKGGIFDRLRRAVGDQLSKVEDQFIKKAKDDSPDLREWDEDF